MSDDKPSPGRFRQDPKVICGKCWACGVLALIKRIDEAGKAG